MKIATLLSTLEKEESCIQKMHYYYFRSAQTQNGGASVVFGLYL